MREAVPFKRIRPSLFGPIPGVAIGDLFPTRLAVLAAGLHRQVRAGVSGTAADGAEAIIVSPAYEDDVDLGHTVYYSGQGGRSTSTGKQVADQQINHPLNQALLRSLQAELPVRVIRKVKTEEGPMYRYDGLYIITDMQEIVGKSGFKVLLFTVSEGDTKKPH